MTVLISYCIWMEPRPSSTDTSENFQTGIYRSDGSDVGPMMIRCYLPGHLVLQMQHHVISFYGVTSRIRFYVPPLPASIPELKVRIRIAIESITADILQTVWNEIVYFFI